MHTFPTDTLSDDLAHNSLTLPAPPPTEAAAPLQPDDVSWDILLRDLTSIGIFFSTGTIALLLRRVLDAVDEWRRTRARADERAGAAFQRAFVAQLIFLTACTVWLQGIGFLYWMAWEEVAREEIHGGKRPYCDVTTLNLLLLGSFLLWDALFHLQFALALLCPLYLLGCTFLAFERPTPPSYSPSKRIETDDCPICLMEFRWWHTKVIPPTGHASCRLHPIHLKCFLFISQRSFWERPPIPSLLCPFCKREISDEVVVFDWHLPYAIIVALTWLRVALQWLGRRLGTALMVGAQAVISRVSRPPRKRSILPLTAEEEDHLLSPRDGSSSSLARSPSFPCTRCAFMFVPRMCGGFGSSSRTVRLSMTPSSRASRAMQPLPVSYGLSNEASEPSQGSRRLHRQMSLPCLC
ncbi:unnamed protein product [Vitrella brassicaformis CCMP3155]|uniref:Uncharacterized protein n=1 Tax=Vitrella brassicaformis (strain CCMP3155) TaxID=1169540 RepID=A0A0G4EXQ7_VITBC|nr:unnamed protein product [Vitrella brassicaformis CCMP3155]|eukprot:CEM03394.1 unnamed protein product [Vitrella brassicaformis CCMP3155]